MSLTCQKVASIRTYNSIYRPLSFFQPRLAPPTSLSPASFSPTACFAPMYTASLAPSSLSSYLQPRLLQLVSPLQPVSLPPACLASSNLTFSSLPRPYSLSSSLQPRHYSSAFFSLPRPYSLAFSTCLAFSSLSRSLQPTSPLQLAFFSLPCQYSLAFSDLSCLLQPVSPSSRPIPASAIHFSLFLDLV
ncbi:hypothetical protein E2C01_073673 [Portunus trituberculatus]|uniref:Uncharacterized protein n=1 Tax=Portunus trituberculatus TaxID=210409 RepID=A0A5B7I3M3_PORTR|nr:hypothetical protein [Portunus trituberculatus]